MKLKVAAACLFVVLLAGCAKTVMPAPAVGASDTDGLISLQSPVTAPYAFTHFCLRYADECRVHEANLQEAHDNWADITDVNNEVNRTIASREDNTNIGFDAWRIAPHAGNCNDYAVTKRHDLLDRGWPSRSLLLAEVVTRQGEHHLVLVVRTGKQDVVLDNLTPAIQDWSETSYRWVRMQSPDDPQAWLSVASA